MDNWYYALNGAQQGPVSKAALQQMLASGQLPAETLVWREGMANWIPAHTVPELASDTGEIPFAPSNDPVPQPRQMPVIDPILPYGRTDSIYAPQHQTHLAFAGFWLRVAAYLIDAIILFVPFFILGFVVRIVSSTAPPGSVNASAVFGTCCIQILQIIVPWIYYAKMESSEKMATLGKQAVGIIVISETGERVSFGRATGRHFGKIISAIILCVGFMMAGFTEKKQALHDIMAGALVVKKQS